MGGKYDAGDLNVVGSDGHRSYEIKKKLDAFAPIVAGSLWNVAVVASVANAGRGVDDERQVLPGQTSLRICFCCCCCFYAPKMSKGEQDNQQEQLHLRIHLRQTTCDVVTIGS